MADCTIQLKMPIAAVKVMAGQELIEYQRSASATETLRRQAEAEVASLRLARKAMEAAAEGVAAVYRKVCSEHAGEIAQLAVEIASKVLRLRVERGDYAIKNIIEDALREAPMDREILVRVNPLDIEECRKWEQEGGAGGVTFAADPSVGRAECLVETPRGSVEAFIEGHLKQISEALRNSHGELS